MPNIINMKTAYVYLFQKKKDVSIFFAIHGERLFPCHFISTLSCASAVIKWHFFKFALTALRFLKSLILGLIPLNSDHFFKYTINQLSINGEIKNSITLSKVLHYLFLLCLFWLVFYYIILFQKTQFPIQQKTYRCTIYNYKKRRKSGNRPSFWGTSLKKWRLHYNKCQRLCTFCRNALQQGYLKA